VIKPKFADGKEFSNGIAKVNIGGKRTPSGLIVGGKWGYIDKTGKYVWKPTE